MMQAGMQAQNHGCRRWPLEATCRGARWRRPLGELGAVLWKVVRWLPRHPAPQRWLCGAPCTPCGHKRGFVHIHRRVPRAQQSSTWPDRLLRARQARPKPGMPSVSTRCRLKSSLVFSSTVPSFTIFQFSSSSSIKINVIHDSPATFVVFGQSGVRF